MGSLVAYSKKLLLLFFALSLMLTPSDEAFAKPRKRSACRSALEILTVVATLGATLSLAGRARYEVAARLEGKDHIGQGIALDVKEFEDRLSWFDKAALKNPKENAKQLAEAYTRMLDGDYDKNVERKIQWLPAMRDASSFMDGRSGSAGVCRNKVCILAGLLRHYGIRTHIYSVIAIPGYSEGQGHTFIYLPDEDAVYDPVAGYYGQELEDVRKNKFFEDKVMINNTYNPAGFPYWVLDGFRR